MKKRQDWVSVNHPRSGKRHDLPDFFPVKGFETVNSAVGAGWFIQCKAALINAPHGIV